MTFAPSPDFYAAAAQVIPLLLLALVFEARLIGRIMVALRVVHDARTIQVLAWSFQADDPSMSDEEAARTARSFYQETLDMGERRPPRVHRRRWAMWGLLAGLAAAVAAEAVAVLALALDDPPDSFAVVVLAGGGLLLAGLLASLADAVVQEFHGRIAHERPSSAAEGEGPV